MPTPPPRAHPPPHVLQPPFTRHSGRLQESPQACSELLKGWTAARRKRGVSSARQPTHNFPCHEDQADHRGEIELPPRSLLGRVRSVAGGPAGVAVPRPLQAQLNGGEVRDVAKHGSAQVFLLRDSQVRPERQSSFSQESHSEGAAGKSGWRNNQGHLLQETNQPASLQQEKPHSAIPYNSADSTAARFCVPSLLLQPWLPGQPAQQACSIQRGHPLRPAPTIGWCPRGCPKLLTLFFPKKKTSFKFHFQLLVGMMMYIKLQSYI